MKKRLLLSFIFLSAPAFAALPDPQSLDYGFMGTGTHNDISGKSTLDTTTLDYGFMRTGTFVGYQPAAAGGGGVVKTINGTAYASVKTINGTAVASVKTLTGAATQ
jgi:hypothetical protein